MSAASKDMTKAQLLDENEDLRRRLQEAEQTIEAIRQGEVDAIVVAGVRGEQIYSLTGAEHTYRVIVETMNEAALAVDLDGTILFCNQQFCDLMRIPLCDVAGHRITEYVAERQQPALETAMAEAQTRPIRRHLALRAEDGTAVPVLLSGSLLQEGDHVSLCLVASDLTELEESANSIRVLREHRQALEESEARFRAIFESSQDAVILVDDKGVSIQANPAVETVFALPPEQLVGHALPEFVDDSADFASIWRAFLGAGALRAELKVTDAHGQVRDVDCYAVANILPGWHLAVIRDITERKRAEEALEEANVRLRVYAEELKIHAEELHAQTEELKVVNEELQVNEQALRESRAEFERQVRFFDATVAAIPDYVYAFDRDKRFVYVNQAVVRLYGLPKSEVIGKSLTDLNYPPELASRLNGHIERIFATGESIEDEVFYESPTGFAAYFQFLWGPVRDAEDNVELVVGTSRDTTARKRAEKTLRDQQEKLALALGAAEMGTWTYTFADQAWELGERARAIYGVTESNVLHDEATVRTLLHPDDVEPMWQAVQAACDPAGDGRYVIDYRVREPGGQYRWLRAWGQVQFEGSGADRQAVRMIGTTRDITAERQAQERLHQWNVTLETRVAERTAELRYRARQLQKLALELSQAEDRERRRLAEILHDDLQQQLAAVKFHLGILAGRVREDARVQATTTHLDGMLKNAIETSRSLSHELSPAVMYHGDMGEIFEWLAHQIQTKHGMIVRVDPLGQIDVQSDALKVFLFKAVQEMLFNAVKHARVGEAKVRVRRRGRYVCLCVSDRGRGFNPQDLKQTTGFGLMSIRERIGLLGGRMKIHSAKGVGSRFIITVPDGQRVEEPVGATLRGRPLEDRTADGSLASREGGREGPPLRVLIADDHEVVRHGLAALLAEAVDVELVGQAGNGREAVDMAYQLRPDVVIMDVAMPLMNGDEAARQIRKHLPQTRIVALSMYEEAGAVERMQRAGAESYLLKTAPAEELLAAVRGK